MPHQRRAHFTSALIIYAGLAVVLAVELVGYWISPSRDHWRCAHFAFTGHYLDKEACERIGGQAP